MKYMIKRNSTIIIGLFTTLVLFATILPAVVSAATVTASLSPSASSIQQGNTFTVTVNLSTGSATILDAIGRVNFNSSQLQFMSASYSPSSSWGSQGPSAGQASSYYVFDVTSTSNPSGNLGVAQLTFKALAGSGNASITLSNVEVSDGDNPPPALHSVSAQNTSVALTTPPATPAPSSSTPSTPPAAPKSNTTASETKPTNNYTASPTPTPTAEEQASNSTIVDEEPVPVTDFKDSTGYPVEIKILDKDGVPRADIEVTLADKKSKTDQNGIALFYGVVAGEYTVVADGVESTVTVSAGEPSVPQSYEFTQTESNSNNLLIAGVVVIALLAMAGFLLYKNRSFLAKKNKKESYVSPANSSNPVHLQEKPTSTDVDNYLKPDPPKVETVINPDNNEMKD